MSLNFRHLAVASLLLTGIAAHAELATVIGGGAGGAAGAAIGNQIGGRNGTVIGGALGGAIGAGATTSGSGQTGAIVGGAVGGGAGAMIGQRVGGTSGAVVGAGAGGAVGAELGRSVSRSPSGPSAQGTVVVNGGPGVVVSPQQAFVPPGHQKKGRHGHPPGRAVGWHKNH